MIIDLPATTTVDVSKRLVKLAEADGVVGRVLTLLVVTDEGAPTELAISAANEASREHPCRVIVLARGNPDASQRLDAQIRVGGDAGASEVVVLRLYGPLAAHGAAVATPFLLPDTPIVTWWPAAAPAVPAVDPLGALGVRRITDAQRDPDPATVLARRAESYRPGDSDLAWAATTTWRGLLTAAVDEPPHENITAASVSGPAGTPSIDLLAGWLAARLQVPVSRTVGGFEVRLERASGPLTLCVGNDNTAVITAPGRPDGKVAVAHRDSGDFLAEELRRLDPDIIYHQALQGFSAVTVE